MVRDLVLAAACAVSTSCAEAGDAPWRDAGPLTPLYAASGATALEFRGVWRSRGYGWVLDIDEAGVTRYQEGDVCYAIPEETGWMSAMASVRYRYARAVPGEAAIFQLLDGDTNVVFDRLDALPPACARPVDAPPHRHGCGVS